MLAISHDSPVLTLHFPEAHEMVLCMSDRCVGESASSSFDIGRDHETSNRSAATQWAVLRPQLYTMTPESQV